MFLRIGLGVLGGVGFAGLVLLACSSDTSTESPATVDAGTPDGAAPNGDANASAVDSGVGEPIGPALASPGVWVWVDFPDSACGNGSATGIAVNVGTTKRVVIYMEGGGACWNATTCFALDSATYLNGFGYTDFVRSVVPKMAGGELDRTVATNPFKDDSLVYIPYCTGDVHAGDSVQTYPGAPSAVNHHGRKNMDAFLKRIVPTFKDASRVELTGSSAGGFGSAVNYWRVREAFGSLRVDLIDDSGPPFPNADIAYYTDWAAAWDIAGAYPADCTTCATDITTLLPYYAQKYPDARIALLSYSQDSTIRTFFGTKDGPTFETQLDSVISTQLDPTTNAKAFEVDGNLHTMLGRLSVAGGDEAVDGGPAPEILSTWLTDMVSDSASWATLKVTPPAH